jgi:hypothetical protein
MPFVRTSKAHALLGAAELWRASSTSASSAAPLAPLRLPPLPFWSASVSSCACTARRCVWFENSMAVATFAYLLPQPSLHCTWITSTPASLCRRRR